MYYPSINEMTNKFNVLFGIVYDIHGSPCDLMLKYSHKKVIINEIVIFDNFVDFQSYYNKGEDFEDFSVVFTCNDSLEEIEKAFKDFGDIFVSHVECEEKIHNILNNKLNTEIYEAY